MNIDTAQMTDTQINDFIKTSYSSKPKDLFLPELTWKFAVRNVLRQENILLVGMAGSAKTLTAQTLAHSLGRPFFNIPLGSTQDPRSALIGNTHYNKERGTYFSESYFVSAIQTENAVILLDELSRAHPEVWNILMPVLDIQRTLRLEEKENSAVVKVAKGVSFIATANIGSQYSSTRVLDRALLDRFTLVEVATLNSETEYELLKQKYPNVQDTLLKAVSEIASLTRQECSTDSGKLSNCISTRASVRLAGYLNDGFTLEESAEVGIYPFFSADGGADSERTYIKQIVQKYCGETPKTESNTEKDFLFSDEDIENAKRFI